MVGEYTAVIVCEPTARMLTGNDAAEEFAPDDTSGTVPRAVAPSVKAMEPVGGPLEVGGLVTVAVKLTD